MELLAPAGSYESLRAAVQAGADAVYIGGSRFGARAYADNPQEDQLLRAIDYCHIYHKKIYLTVNTLIKEKEMEYELEEYLAPYYEAGLDAVIVQDPGVLRYLKNQFPQMELHASTQMTITGTDSVRFLQEYGVSRVVPARELSLEEIRHIIEETGVETECFIHGAMCYSYSGECLLSSLIGGRSGNRGRCAQPCRLPYEILSEKPSGKAAGPYLMSLKDMCAIDLLVQIHEAGIQSLKIEGRMKRPEYTAGVVSVYRKYLDQYEQNGWKPVAVSPQDRQILMDLYSRGGFSEGYYRQRNGSSMMTMQRPNHLGSKAAVLRRKKSVFAEAVCDLEPGDILEVPDFKHGKKGLELTIKDSIRKGQKLVLPPVFSKAEDGSTFYRTRHEQLLTRLKEDYLLKEKKVSIQGKLTLAVKQPAVVSLSCRGYTVVVTGEEVLPAQNSPLREEVLQRQMKKTGDSPFTLTKLEVSVTGECFMTMQSLNSLRRRALAELEEGLLAGYRREIPKNRTSKADGFDEDKASALEKKECLFHVSVLTEEQLEAVLAWNQDSTHRKINRIYLDLLFLSTAPEQYSQSMEIIRRVKESGAECYLQMMPVLRRDLREKWSRPYTRKLLSLADGFLVRTLEVLAFLKAEGYSAPVCGDDALYSCSRQAEIFWQEAGVDNLTYSSELTYFEMEDLHRKGGELIVYGKTPLMVTAQCLKKNLSGCTQIPQQLWLKDRKQMKFPVMTRCPECCNMIYNSVALNLLGCRREIEKLHPGALRVSFTSESAREAESVLKQWEAFFVGKEDPAYFESGTRGHFRKGVE